MRPAECAVVAAHLFDLQAAKGLGFQTVYVERGQEEEFSAEDMARAKDPENGYIDMWVGLGEDGFIEVARRFDIP